MSIKRRQKARPNYEDLGLTMEKVEEVVNCCTAGAFDMETMQRACKGFEWIQHFIILSATKRLSYDQLEYSLKLGQIPVGRSNFYMFRRRFYANLSRELNCWEDEKVKDQSMKVLAGKLF